MHGDQFNLSENGLKLTGTTREQLGPMEGTPSVLSQNLVSENSEDEIKLFLGGR